MLSRCLIFLFAASSGFAGVVQAQFVVRVESNGAAVFGAEVAVWSDSGRLAVGRTDGAGIVRLPLDRAKSPVSFITARRVGFAPGRLAFPASDSVVVWLARRTTDLPAVAVTDRVLHCPATSEDAAVTLWRRAAAQYTAGQDTMPWVYIASVAEETVPSAERGFGDSPTGAQQLGGGRVGTSKGMLNYGTPLAFIRGTYHPSFGAPYERWTYPMMFGSAASAFTSAYFFEHHTFVVLGHSGSATTLGFCARSRAEPEMEGELQISADTLLLGAHWSFLMPHDDEDAGGEATFAESPLDGARYLVAITTTTWHRVRPGLYEQERTVLDAWKFAHMERDARFQSWQDRGDRSGTP